MNKYSHLFQASVNYFSSISFWIMIFNQKTTVLIIVFAGIAYLFIICLFWRDEGTATSSLPPIKTSGSRHIAENDFEENGDSKGILFWTDFYCTKWFITQLIKFVAVIFSFQLLQDYYFGWETSFKATMMSLPT